MFQKRMAPSQQGNGTTGKKKDLTVSCDETKHETTSPEQDHSITSARSNGWSECRDKKRCRHRADGEECLLTFPFIGLVRLALYQALVHYKTIQRYSLTNVCLFCGLSA